MKAISRRYVTLFIVLLFMIMGTTSVSANQSDSLIMFNLNDKEHMKDSYTDLNGEWHFFDRELLSPTQVHDQLNEGMGEIVSIPSSFQTQTGEVNSFGTYSTMIYIPEAYVGETLAISIPYQYSAYRAFVDEYEIARNGVVGQDSSTHIPEMSPKIGYFFAQSNEVLLTVQVSSFDHIRGGFEKPIYLGRASTVNQKFNQDIIETLFINGCIFIIGLFMVLFALYRGQEHRFLIFGLFSMLISVRALFTVPFYYTLIFLEMSWLWGTRLEYILTEATSMFFVILLWKWYEKEFAKEIMYGLVMIHLTLIGITFFTNPLFFQKVFFMTFYLTIPVFFYFIYVIFKSIRNQSGIAKINLLGMLVVFLAAFNDLAVSNNWYQSRMLVLPAVGIYVVIHVILMSKHFAQETRRREQLNTELVALNISLDEKVHERTIQLEKSNKRLEKIARTDSLTGIFNRHSFNEFIARIFHSEKETSIPLSLLMIDLDNFKSYNDYYGHINGDNLLKEVVQVIGNQLPNNSHFARYGGEEFVVVLPNTSRNTAIQIAEQIRISVKKAQFWNPASEFKVMTCSIGIATMTNETTFKSEVELIEMADKKLYQSKLAGRNQVKSS